jgi:hypothetical protein
VIHAGSESLACSGGDLLRNVVGELFRGNVSALYPIAYRCTDFLRQGGHDFHICDLSQVRRIQDCPQNTYAKNASQLLHGRKGLNELVSKGWSV